LPGATLTTNPGVLYHDLTCTYCEWRDDDLITFGYPRDRVEGAPQVNWGMIVTPEGLPITVQVYPGNTKDETTVTGMRERLEKVFGLHGGVYVGDRGMRTKDNLSESNVAREVVTANGVRHVVLLNERRR
jgi:transposase